LDNLPFQALNARSGWEMLQSKLTQISARKNKVSKEQHNTYIPFFFVSKKVHSQLSRAQGLQFTVESTIRRNQGNPNYISAVKQI
jgi:hypothetical protein